MIRRNLLLACLVCGWTSVGQAIDFTEIARFNVDSTAADPDNPEPQDIGSNPSAVAWNGSQLFVAGFNNSGGFSNSAIVEVLNATDVGVVDTPNYGNAFGSLFTPNSRGYSGLALSPTGSQLAAAWDDGFDAPEGLQVFDTSSQTLDWSKQLRGGSGVAFDPGFPGGNASQGQGVAWVQSFDSGRRSLQNAATGADVWTPTDGMIWHPLTPGLSFISRDIDFDPDTGDMYTRTANEVIFARRTGDNLIGDKGLLADEPDAAFVNNQHLAFLSNVTSGDDSGLDLVIYNNREVASGGQDFFAVNSLVMSDGTPAAPNFTFLNGDTPAAGAGWYDYDFDPATQTLALLDSSNRNVHIFAVGGGGSPITCDFNGDMSCDGVDIDLLVENIAIGPADPATFDLTGDGMVNLADRDAWLAEAGALNLASGNPYLIGDANLDGNVDGQDFIAWNSAKFTANAAWTQGDFTADGVVDGQDFVAWNGNKFQASDTAAVPEPSSGLLLASLLALAVTNRTSRRS